MSETSRSERLGDEGIEVATLLGVRGLEDSIACLSSLVRCSTASIRFRVHEDGSLGEADRARLRNELPVGRFVDEEMADHAAERMLQGHPNCLALRRKNVLARKLFDVIAFETSDALRYVDSDVLFLETFHGGPFERDGDQAVFFPDIQSAYSVGPFEKLPRSAQGLPARVNTGIIRFPIARFDLERIESFLANWRGRAPEWIEQTCWAVVAGVDGTLLLDDRQFRIPGLEPLCSARAVALHFVSPVRSALRPAVDAYPHSDVGELVEIRYAKASPLGRRQVLSESVLRRLGRT